MAQIYWKKISVKKKERQLKYKKKQFLVRKKFTILETDDKLFFFLHIISKKSPTNHIYSAFTYNMFIKLRISMCVLEKI